ncbi:transposase [Terrimonas rubra]|uniref:Transposase n=1 Tax=Terrimonas rubra TaxID=1035890 RepID=A0ABW6A511_9BACT
MPTKREIPESEGVFFITFTNYQWRPLIAICNGYDIVYNWFDYLKDQGHYILGYVIMPNHVHVLIAFKNCNKSLNTIVGNGKRFMAYAIVSRLQEMKQDILLSELSGAVSGKEKERNKKHEIWEPSFDWKECRNNVFILQKLNYIHDNPCKGKWSLVNAPYEYQHSSAGFYITGHHTTYAVLNYFELGDIDLTKL